jgi:predicted sulfurtransferase
MEHLPPMKPILNIAAYQFVRLEELEGLRQQMLDALNARQLKGHYSTGRRRH